MRTTWVSIKDPSDPSGYRLVEKSKFGPVPPRVHIIGDFKEPVRSMIDGREYDSRKSYHDHVKENGCEVVGNDWNSGPKRREILDAPGLDRDLADAFKRQS